MPTFSALRITPHLKATGLQGPNVLAFVVSHVDPCPLYQSHIPSAPDTRLEPIDWCTHCPLQTLLRAPLPASVHTKSFVSTAEHQLKGLSQDSMSPEAASRSPLRCVFSLTCLAHSTARYFCVLVYNVVRLFFTAAYRSLEGRDCYILTFLGILHGTCLVLCTTNHSVTIY